MLLPLLYHSFHPESLCLWTISCKRHGSKQMYDIKLMLYKALLNRDTQETLRLTAGSIDNAMDELAMYIS